MGNLIYLIAGLLFLIWFVAFIVFNIAGTVHLIFLGAVLLLVFNLIKNYKKN